MDDAKVLPGTLTVLGEIDLGRMYTHLRMPDGRILEVPTALLTQVSHPVAGLLAETGVSEMTAVEGMVIPLVEEQLTVGKRTVPIGTVRLRKRVQEYAEQLDEPLVVRTFDIERVVLNRRIEVAPEVRQEGETTVYPLVEEQMVLTKQLILKEEVRVTRRVTERRDTQVVTLRREHLEVEREST